MSRPASHLPTDARTPSPAAPGRPKDPGKAAAILQAAKRMFLLHGYEGASMDLIAGEAGVSKLTLYSHFGDKEGLFAAAVQAYCEEQLPATLFESSPQTPLRERLVQIAEVFFAVATSPEAIAGHRMLCSPQLKESGVPELFWEAGPARLQQALAQLFAKRTAAGELAAHDAQLAASQFCTLLKGDPHARLLLGCAPPDADDVRAHLHAAVDMFLRAYRAAP